MSLLLYTIDDINGNDEDENGDRNDDMEATEISMTTVTHGMLVVNGFNDTHGRNSPGLCPRAC